ncbi:MAG: sulfotransferase family protein [Longimicrobiales bacterium]
MPEKIPTFFIVGAPKSGTTAVYQFLRAHPQVFMPNFKEPNFFCADFCATYPYAVRDQGMYLSLFSAASAETQIGEASVWYLYSREAAAAIRRFNPDARIIAMLRNPVDAMHSLHAQRLWSGNEDIHDFRKALEAECDRSRGRRLPPAVQIPEGTLYRRVFRYAEQLQRYIDVLGRDKIHVVIYDDFRALPDETYREILRFLGVEDAFQPQFQVINSRRRIRSSRLHGLMLRPPKAVQRTMQLVLPPEFRAKVYWRIMDAVVAKKGGAPLDPELRAELTEECAPDIGRLGDLLGRDLTFWLRKP